MSQKRAWGLGIRSVLLLPLAFILLAFNSMTCDPRLAVPSLAADSLLPPPNPPEPTPNSDPLTDGLVEELLDKPIAPNRDTSPQPSTPATKNPNSQPSNFQNKNSGTKDPSTKDSVASGNDVTLDETLTESTQRLMRGDVSMGTQELQAKIVEQFDALIQAVDESQREQSKKKTTSKAGVGKGDAKSKTTKPPPGNQRDGGESQLRMTAQGQEPSGESSDGQSTAGSDTANQAIENAMKEVQLGDQRTLQEHIWGHLPERTRRKMEASATDRFLPRYETWIEEYYRRLNRIR